MKIVLKTVTSTCQLLLLCHNLHEQWINICLINYFPFTLPIVCNNNKLIFDQFKLDDGLIKGGERELHLVG